MDKKEFKYLVKQRDNLITSLNSKFENTVQESQKALLKVFVKGFVDMLQVDENGNVASTSYNRNLLLSIDKIFNDYGKKHNVMVLAQLMQGVGSVLNYNNKYYSNFAGNAELLPLKKRVVDNMQGWLGFDDKNANENGYLGTLVKNDAVKNQLKDLSMRAVHSQKGWQQTKQEFEDFIDGKDGKTLGALQKYYRNYTYDLYSQIDRATAKTYADDLKFEFAIYEGGLIETSRPFCEEHNGNVYHISEILKFDPQTAKQPNYNPLTDLGGYACRHHLNYIPNALALALRPDAKKLVGTGITGLIKQKEKEEVKPPKKEVEKKVPAAAKTKTVEQKQDQPTPRKPIDPTTKFDDIKPLKIEPFVPSKTFAKDIDKAVLLQEEKNQLRKDFQADLNEYNTLVSSLNKLLRTGKVVTQEMRDEMNTRYKANREMLKAVTNKAKEIEADGAIHFKEMLDGLTSTSKVKIGGTIPPKHKEVVEIFKKLSAGYNDDLVLTFKSVRGRANFDMQKKFVNLAASDDKFVALHELGHSLELNNHVMKAAVDFLERRTAGKSVRQLSEVMKGYGIRERYKDGGFFDPYVGKIYRSINPKNYQDTYATEVISMGLEQMMRNPRLFYKQDKEHFELIYNLFFKK